MNYRAEMARILSARTGVDCATMVDDLYAAAALDDGLARRYVIVHDTMQRFSTTALSMRSVQEEVAEIHGVSYIAVYKMLTKTKQVGTSTR